MFKDIYYTKLAKKEIFSDSLDLEEKDLFESTEYAMQLEKRNPVLEGVCNYLKLSSTDLSAIRKELNKRYKEMGIADGVPKTVKNWLEGTPVNPTANRSNLYNLCLALGLGLKEIKAFFLKNYMTIPFNYKDRIDAIYLYGISHDMEYKEIQVLIDELKKYEDITGTANDETVAIEGYILEIDDLSKFKEYLIQHTYSRREQYNTALNEINRLIVLDKKYAEIESIIKPELGKDNNDSLDDNIASLLNIIYDYDNQKRYQNKQTNISKSQYLPRMFRENFPNDEEFSRIKNKEASPDLYRKALIILKFYEFYCSLFITSIYGKSNPSKTDKKKNISWERNLVEIKEDWDDFYKETSKLLAKCGFVQMYARNPFDWLILYCANSIDPMDTLRELLQERFLNKYE